MEVALTLIGVAALALWWRGRKTGDPLMVPDVTPEDMNTPDGKTEAITDDPVSVGGKDTEMVEQAVAAAEEPPPRGSINLPPSATNYIDGYVLDKANETDALKVQPEPFKPGADALTTATGQFFVPTIDDKGTEKSVAVPGNSWDPLTLASDQSYTPESIGGQPASAPVDVE